MKFHLSSDFCVASSLRILPKSLLSNIQFLAHLFLRSAFKEVFHFDKVQLIICFSFMVYTFSFLKKSAKVANIYFHVFKFFNVNFYIQDYNPFQVNFCIFYQIRIKVRFFPCGYPTVPAQIVGKKLSFPPLNSLGNFVKINWLYICAFVSGLSSVSLMYMSTFMLYQLP